MKFGQLIKSNNWLSVEITFLNLYPDQEKSIDAYKMVYEKINNIEPTDYEMEIMLEQRYDDETRGEDFIEVYGIKENTIENESTEGFALDFVPWTKWLGMSISEKALTEYNELEIIVHCLYEMTFCGFDEEEIQNKFSDILKLAEECDNMTEEEREKNMISSEDFFKRLGEE